MITLRVHLHSALRRRTSEGWQNQLILTLPAGSCVADLFSRLELPLPPSAVLVVIDRRAAPPSQLLQDGDIVHLLPALAGG